MDTIFIDHQDRKFWNSQVSQSRPCACQKPQILNLCGEIPTIFFWKTATLPPFASANVSNRHHRTWEVKLSTFNPCVRLGRKHTPEHTVKTHETHHEITETHGNTRVFFESPASRPFVRRSENRYLTHDPPSFSVFSARPW